MKTKFWNLEYRMYPMLGDYGWQHSWRLIGRHVAVELNISEYHPDKIKEHSILGRASGGIEFHYSEPPEYLGENCAPHHTRCHILERPCWHDGSSLWVSEHWIPYWESVRKNPQAVFEHLIYRMNEKFGYEEEKVL